MIQKRCPVEAGDDAEALKARIVFYFSNNDPIYSIFSNNDPIWRRSKLVLCSIFSNNDPIWRRSKLVCRVSKAQLSLRQSNYS